MNPKLSLKYNLMCVFRLNVMCAFLYHSEQFLGFHSLSNDKPGRRAVTNADLRSFIDTENTSNEQEERDGFILQVQIVLAVIMTIIY